MTGMACGMHGMAVAVETGGQSRCRKLAALHSKRRYLCAMVSLRRVYAGRDDHHIVAYLAEPLYQIAEANLHACSRRRALILISQSLKVKVTRPHCHHQFGQPRQRFLHGK